MKKIFLLLTILFLTVSTSNNTEAQWFDKLKKGTEKLIRSTKKASRNFENSEFGRNLQKMDPSKWILNKLNSNPEFQNYKRKIEYNINSINSVIRDNTVVYNDSKVYYKTSKKNISLNNVLPFIQKEIDSKHRKLITTIIIQNKNFQLLKIDELKYVPFAEGSIPVDSRLEEIIKCAVYQKNSHGLNKKYFKNIAYISSIITQINQTSIYLSDSFLNGIQKINSLSYGGITAVSLIDPMLESNTGVSLRDLQRGVEEFRKAAKTAYEESKYIYDNSNKVHKSLIKLSQNRKVNGNDISTLENSLRALSKSIHNMADKIRETERVLANSSSGLKKLSRFTKIEYFRNLGDLIVKLEKTFSNSRLSIHNYASNLENFVTVSNKEAKELTGTSRSYLLAKYNSYNSFNLALIHDINKNINLLSSSELMKGSSFHNSFYSSYKKYVTTILDRSKEEYKARDNDLYSSYLVNQDITKWFEKFPKKELNTMYTKIREDLSKAQIVGSPDLANFDAQFSKTFVDGKCSAKQANLDQMNKLTMASVLSFSNIENSNNTFYIIIGLISILGIVVPLVIVRRKRKLA